MPTIYDIAKQAEVSPTMVSAVLRGAAKKARISDRSAAHVVMVARNLGYRPNASARAIRTRRFGAIALLQSSGRYHSYLPTGLAGGIHNALAERDLHLMVARAEDEQLTDEAFVPKILREWMCDGLLIDYINDIPQRLVDLIDSYKIPAIWINAKRPADCVYQDDFAAGREAARSLLESGHRRIAYIRCASNYHTRNRHYSEIDRRDGYAAAMREAELSPWIIGDGQVVPRPQLPQLTRALLSLPQRPTAMITYGNSEATALLFAAMNLGLRVPEDLAIIGFAGIMLDVGGIPISTMLAPEHQLGQQAVSLLLKKIAAPAVPLAPLAVPLRLQKAEPMQEANVSLIVPGLTAPPEV